MDIDSNCPYLLLVFGETTSHLTSKWRGTFQYYFFFNVENSIKREMRKNCFLKKIYFFTPPPPPPPEICLTQIFLDVGNSMKREENMKFWKKKFKFFNIKKIHKKFKQHSINTKNYTAHPHDLVHVPAKFRENTAMRFWVTVRKLNVTDRRTDRQTDGRGALQYLPSRASGAAGDN